jgi:hypothetical protein
MTEIEQPPNGQPAEPPVPIQAGRYNLFDLPDGGYALLWRPDGEEDWQRRDIPGFLVKMAASQAEGGMMGKLMGMMNRGG